MRCVAPAAIGDEVRRSSCHGPADDWPVFVGELDSLAIPWVNAAARGHLDVLDEAAQSITLILISEVSTRLGDSVIRCQQDRRVEAPESRNTRVLAIRRREEDVGVNEETIHRSVFVRWVMRNAAGVDPQLPYFLESTTVVVGIHGVGQDELGLALGPVQLDRDGHGGAQENPLWGFLRDDL